jgi:hypothetical protein
MDYLAKGDHLSFVRAVDDLENVGGTPSFLSRFLRQQATRFWATRRVGKPEYLEFAQCAIDGDFTVVDTFGPVDWRKSAGEARFEWKERGDWRRCNSWLDEWRCIPTIEGAEWRERILFGEEGSCVYLAAGLDAYELRCFGPSEIGRPKAELWRRSISFAQHDKLVPPRVLWVNGGVLLVVLPTREFVRVDVASGVTHSRACPAIEFTRVFDFSEKNGVLVSVPSSPNRFPYDGLAILDASRGEVLYSSAARTDDEVLDVAWRDDSVVVLVAARRPGLLVRSDQYILARPNSYYDDHRRMDFRAPIAAAEGDCDGFRCVHDVNSGCTWGRRLTVVHAGISDTGAEAGKSHIMLSQGGSEVLQLSKDLTVAGASHDDHWRVTGLSLLPDVPDVLRRGVGDRVAIDPSGTTALFATCCGVSAVDLRTGDPIGKLSFAGQEINYLREIQLDGSGDDAWLDHPIDCSLPDNCIDTPRAVWVDASGKELMASFGKGVIGVSFNDGALRCYAVDQGERCVSTPDGHSVFAARSLGGTQFFAIEFGDSPSARPLGFVVGFVRPECWSVSTRYFAAGNRVYNVITGQSTMEFDAAEDPAKRVAVSDCGRRVLEWNEETGYVVHEAVPNGVCRVTCLDESSRPRSYDQELIAWAFSPDGDHVVAAESGGWSARSRLCFWCVHSGRLCAQVGTQLFNIRQLVFSPDGASLICVSSDGAEVFRTPDAALSSTAASAIRSERNRCFTEIQRAQSAAQGAETYQRRGVWGWRFVRPPLAETCRVAEEFYKDGEPHGCSVPLIQRQLRAVLNGWTEHRSWAQPERWKPKYIR